MFLSLKKTVLFSLYLLGLTLSSKIVLADPIFVDKELILEIDVSDPTQYNDILSGYANAFNNPTVQNRIEGLQDGVAVAVQFFASGQTQLLTNSLNYFDSNNPNTAIESYFNVGAQWFILNTATDADRFSNLLNQLIGNNTPNQGNPLNNASDGCETVNFNGSSADGIGTGTNIAGAIQQGTCEINRTAQFYSFGGINNGLIPSQSAKIIANYEQIINISTDGTQDTNLTGDTNVVGTALTDAQLQSANLQINPAPAPPANFTFDSPITRINGLAVGGANLNNVVGGVNKGNTNLINDNTFDAGTGVNGSFIEESPDYSPGFENALALKLEQELEAVPFEFKPGFGLLLGLGIFGFRHWQLSKKQKDKEILETKTDQEKSDDDSLPDEKVEHKDLCLK